MLRSEMIISCSYIPRKENISIPSNVKPHFQEKLRKKRDYLLSVSCYLQKVKVM